MSKPNAEIARHPLAIAWDEWLASGEGEECVELPLPTNTYHYLVNRLHRAFDAGATASQSTLAKQVLDNIEESAPWRQELADIVTVYLRDLFSRLGIAIEE